MSDNCGGEKEVRNVSENKVLCYAQSFGKADESLPAKLACRVTSRNGPAVVCLWAQSCAGSRWWGSMASVLGSLNYVPLSQRSERRIFMATRTKCLEHHDRESTGCYGNRSMRDHRLP